MKNTFYFLFLLVLIPSLSIAQDYQPMLQEGSFWDVISMDHDSECGYNPRRFYLDEEVEFEGNLYHKLREHSIVNHEGEAISCLFQPYNENSFVEAAYTYSDVYIREDISERKVYVWAPDPLNGGPSQEFILYDFTLEIGDVLPENTYSMLYGDSDMVVTNIQFFEGLKYIYIENDHGYYSYQEGIGGESGIISPILSIFEAPDQLYCHGNVANQNECSIFLGTDDYTKQAITIYPNPVKETLFVACNNNSSLELFNILGKHIYTNKNNHSIDMSNYTKGVYLLKVTDEIDGYTKTFKIVVE